MTSSPSTTVPTPPDAVTADRPGSVSEVFLAFLKLGLTSFGGPIAHLGYFRDELITRRRWLDERGYADLVALCQFLPGPASSQVGFSLGVLRGGGLLGGLAAWTAFTLPSALLLLAFAYGASAFTGPVAAGVIHGLKLVAVAVVAQAVWGMARSLTLTARARASPSPRCSWSCLSLAPSGSSRRSCSGLWPALCSAGPRRSRLRAICPSRYRAGPGRSR